MTGVELIAVERQRQVEVEGWTPEHDDSHDMAQMVLAGVSYASLAASQVRLGAAYCVPRMGAYWPWSESWWKPSPDPICNLVKAGALIAAEIDRIRRAKTLPAPPEGMRKERTE